MKNTKNQGRGKALENFENIRIGKEMFSLCNRIGLKYGLGDFLGFYRYKFHSCENASLIKYKKKKIIIKFLDDLERIGIERIFINSISSKISTPKIFTNKDKLDSYPIKGKNAAIYEYIPNLKKINFKSNKKIKEKYFFFLVELLKQSILATKKIKKIKALKFEEELSHIRLIYENLTQVFERYLYETPSKFRRHIKKIFQLFKDNQRLIKNLICDKKNYIYCAYQQDYMYCASDSKFYFIDPHIRVNLFHFYVALAIYNISKIYNHKHIFDITRFFATEFELKNKLKEIYLLEIYILLLNIFERRNCIQKESLNRNIKLGYRIMDLFIKEYGDEGFMLNNWPQSIK